MFEYKFISTTGDMNGWDPVPAGHSNWLRLLEGKDPRVPQALAEVLWIWYFEAMHQLGELILSEEEQEAESNPETYARVVKDLNWITRRFEVNFKKFEMPAAPESLRPSKEWLSASPANREIVGMTLSAYCIWCIDSCISSLLEGDLLKATTACAYAGDALRISEEQCVSLGKSPLARLALTQNAKAGADKVHVENRRMKSEVFEWLDLNMPNFRSMDGAAETISQKVAPIKFRTARDWVGDWKKLRSASKP